MFKAKYIQDPRYFTYQRRKALAALFLPLVSAVPVGMSVHWEVVSWWAATMSFTLMLVLFFTLLYWHNKEQQLGKQFKLELTPEAIRIRDRKDKVQEQFALEEIDKITLKENYDLPGTQWWNFRHILPEPQYFTLHMEGQARKIYFHFETHYMLQQLQKIQDHWESMGKVTRVKKEGS